MSILITGMKMPRSCEYCRFSGVGGLMNERVVCMFTGANAYMNTAQYLDDCPLVEVPPHGDLIDRDKLREKEFIHDGDAYAVVMSRDIRNSPTIIPAERSE